MSFTARTQYIYGSHIGIHGAYIVLHGVHTSLSQLYLIKRASHRGVSGRERNVRWYI